VVYGYVMAPPSNKGQRRELTVPRSNYSPLDTHPAAFCLSENEARYRRVIESTAEGYWLIGAGSWEILEVNGALCRMLGRDPEELIGHPLLELAAEEERDALHGILRRQLEQGPQGSYETVLVDRNGEHRHVRMNVTSVIDDVGRVIQFFALLTDITTQKQTEFDLRLAATFFQTTTEAITVTDAHNRIVAVNPAFCLITGYSEQEVLGRDPSLLSSGRHSPAFYRAMWETLERLGRWQGEIWNRRKNGEVFPEWLSIVAIRDQMGKVAQYMAIFSDITKRKQDEKKIWHQANYDALTGLPNRTLFLDRLTQAMHQAHHERRQLALMFIDLDRFKYVNDTLGHASGDQLLRSAAQRIASCISESDTLARLGGDEFTVVTGGYDELLEVQKLAERILVRLAEPFDIAGRECFVSGSIGITVYPDDATEVEQLLRNADSAMYRAKEAGRNTLRYFTQEMNEAARRRLRLESDLRRALDNNELEVHFQPIVDANGMVVGAEALTRWSHRDLGPVSPDEFIPLAEEIGIISQIEQWVMQSAIREVAQWRGANGNKLFVSINISAMQCKNLQCFNYVRQLIEECAIAPWQLKLEITERVMIEETESVIELLEAMRDIGVQLAVDDFGTGYSSLSYLKRFPINVLKIDRSFVRDLPDNRDDMGLVEAIVAMAKSLQLQVVAEGVESHEQLAFLHSLGVELVQGFYYSPPLSAEQFRAYLAINSGNYQ
jgi:diguanylate cyclase (GGDEF)-like protein/PAS domain S-box-containing protein